MSPKKIIVAVGLSLLALSPQADARIWFGRFSSPFSYYHNSWLRRPSWTYNHNTSSASKKEESSVDIDRYLDSDLPSKENQPPSSLPSYSQRRNSSSSSSKESPFGDMQKKQTEMQEQMEKQRKEMEEKFSKLNEKKDAPQMVIEQPQLEVPALNVPQQQQQTLPQMQSLPVPQQQALPNVPDLPKLEQPTLGNQPLGGQQQQQGQTQSIQQTEPKEPAKIIMDDDEKKNVGHVQQEEKKEEGFLSGLLTKKFLVAVAVLFLVMGGIVFFSK